MYLFKLAYLALLILLLQTPVLAAATYIDNMTDTDNNTIKSYGNLTPISLVPGYPQSAANAIWGGYAFSFANTARPVGYADYRIQGAGTVTVSLYTWRGTFVSLYDRDTYAFGAYQSDMSAALSGQQVSQALYSPGSGGLFSRAGGKMRKVVYNGLLYECQETAEAPSDLVDYGVNVYAGKDAGSLSRVALPSGAASGRVASLRYSASGQYCYEELTYSLPSGAAYVRVEINDFTYIDVLSGSGTYRASPPSGMRTTLAQVSFSGSNLTLGVPEPLSSASDASASESSASSSSSHSESSSSRRASSSSQPAGSGTGGGGSTGGSSGSASKFTGEVTSTPSGSTPSSGSAKSGVGSSAAPPTTIETTPGDDATSLEERPGGWEVFHLEGPGVSSRSMSALIVTYIIGVCGVTLLVLFRGRG